MARSSSPFSMSTQQQGSSSPRRPAIMTWDAMSASVDTAAKLVSSNTRSDSSLAHIVAVLRELVLQQTRGGFALEASGAAQQQQQAVGGDEQAASRDEAAQQELLQELQSIANELRSVKAELEATKDELRSTMMDLQWHNQQARTYNSNLEDHESTLLLPMNHEGALPLLISTTSSFNLSGAETSKGFKVDMSSRACRVEMSSKASRVETSSKGSVAVTSKESKGDMSNMSRVEMRKASRVEMMSSKASGAVLPRVSKQDIAMWNEAHVDKWLEFYQLAWDVPRLASMPTLGHSGQGSLLEQKRSALLEHFGLCMTVAGEAGTSGMCLPEAGEEARSADDYTVGAIRAGSDTPA